MTITAANPAACRGCGRQFKTQSGLTTHELTHPELARARPPVDDGTAAPTNGAGPVGESAPQIRKPMAIPIDLLEDPHQLSTLAPLGGPVIAGIAGGGGLMLFMTLAMFTGPGTAMALGFLGLSIAAGTWYARARSMVAPMIVLRRLGDGMAVISTEHWPKAARELLPATSEWRTGKGAVPVIDAMDPEKPVVLDPSPLASIQVSSGDVATALEQTDATRMGMTVTEKSAAREVIETMAIVVIFGIIGATIYLLGINILGRLSET